MIIITVESAKKLTPRSVWRAPDDRWLLTRQLAVRDRVHVMQRDAYGELESNSYPLSHLLGANAPLEPWCIDLADSTGTFRLLCFDFDGKARGVVDPELMEQAADDCDALSEALTEQSIRHVVCQSSAGGGRHIWLALAGAPAQLIASLAIAARANYSTLDYGMLHNARTGAARPPLSPHRDGSSSIVLRGELDLLITERTSNEKIENLTAALSERAPQPQAIDTAPSGPVDNRHKAHRTLSAAGAGHMATIRGGSNPSWTGFMCLLSAAHAQWTLSDVEHAARTAPGMEHYRTKNTGNGVRRKRNANEASARLQRQWEKAQKIASLHAHAPNPRGPRDLSDLENIVSEVEDVLHRFTVQPGRWSRTEAAASNRSILTALAYLSLRTGKRSVAASIRDLALLAGVGRTSAAAALRRLAADGFVLRTTAHVGANASEWRIISHFCTASGTVRSQPTKNPRPPTELFLARTALLGELEQLLSDTSHDLFTRPGLGHLAGQLYAALAGIKTPVTVAAAARLLSITERHAATIMSRLRKAKLLIFRKDGWLRSVRDLRDRAARLLGLDGILALRRSRYEAEREVWTWWLAEYSTMRSKPRERPHRPHVTSRPVIFSEEPGERTWPRYPRNIDGTANHKEARGYVDAGVLSPTSRWQLSDAA